MSAKPDQFMICRNCFRRIELGALEKDLLSYSKTRCIDLCHDLVPLDKWWDEQLLCNPGGWHYHNGKSFGSVWGEKNYHTITGRELTEKKYLVPVSGELLELDTTKYGYLIQYYKQRFGSDPTPKGEAMKVIDGIDLGALSKEVDAANLEEMKSKLRQKIAHIKGQRSEAAGSVQDCQKKLDKAKESLAKHEARLAKLEAGGPEAWAVLEDEKPKDQKQAPAPTDQ